MGTTIFDGHILANISNIHAVLDIGFSTQRPKVEFIETALKHTKGMAPAISLKMQEFNIDSA